MRYLLIFYALILFFPSFGQHKPSGKPFKLSGEIKGHDNIKVFLEYQGSNGVFIRDSTVLKNGKFSFHGNIEEPTRAVLFGKTKTRSIDDPNIVELYLEPGVMIAQFEANKLKSGRVSGSHSHKDLALYNKLVDSLSIKWRSIFDTLEAARKRKDTTQLQIIYNNELPKYRAEKKELTLQFIKKHPDSYVSAELLIYQSQTLPLDSLKSLYAGMGQKVRTSKNGNEINSFITAAENLRIGKIAPGFTMPDQDGRLISLADFQGKYVLLDFWASWCIPCRQEHPFLKKALDSFKDQGFTIVSISLDKLADKEDWMKAINQDQLSWTQLCDFKAWQSETVKLFNLLGKGIPANFLLGPKGEIIAKDLRGDDLNMKLTQLFQ